MTKDVKEKAVALTAANFTSLNACTVAVTGSAAKVTCTNYNQNAKLQIQLDAGISIKDYKGISFDFQADTAMQGKKFWLQMVKTGQSDIQTGFYPSSAPATPYSNAVISQKDVNVAANTKETIQLAFDWTDQANILTTQLDEGALVLLGLQLQNANTGSFTISNVKLYV